MHPQKVLSWIFKSYSEVGTQRTMIVAVLAAYKLLNLKATKQASYALYLEQYERLSSALLICYFAATTRLVAHQAQALWKQLASRCTCY